MRSKMLRELAPESELSPDLPPIIEEPDANGAKDATVFVEAIPGPVSSTGVPGPLPLSSPGS